MTSTIALCRECLHERFYHVRYVGTGLPASCIAGNCDCWVFVAKKEDQHQ